MKKIKLPALQLKLETIRTLTDDKLKLAAGGLFANRTEGCSSNCTPTSENGCL